MVSLPKPGAHQIGTARARVGKDRHIGKVRTIGRAIGIHLHGDVTAGLRQLDEVGRLADTANEVGAEQC